MRRVRDSFLPGVAFASSLTLGYKYVAPNGAFDCGKNGIRVRYNMLDFWDRNDFYPLN